MPLDKETTKIMIDMYRENKKATENTLKDIFDKAFETVNNTTEKYNIEAVARNIDPTKVINKEVAGHIWTERIDKYGSDFIYDVHGIIHHGMTNGETFTSMAKKLRDRFGKDIGNTVRIARTEGARVLEDSKYESMKDIAENESVQVFKVWHTMGDEAVRDTHIAMEGVKVPYDEEFVLPSGARCLYPKDTGVPSEDINCRCYVEYVTEIGYNKDRPIEEQTDKQIKLWIKDHDKNLNHEKYEEHNPNSKKYAGKKSTIDVNEKEAQSIIYKNAGTGELLRVNGIWTRKEFISVEKEFGTYKNLNGVNAKTNNGIITYKNNGQCHLIPSSPKRK